MDMIFFVHVIIPCSKLILSYEDPIGQKPHVIVFGKMLVLTCRQYDYTFLIPCVSHINA